MLLELICGADEVKAVEAAVAALQSKAVTVDGLPVHADVVKALASCLISDPAKRATASELCALLGCKNDDASSPAHAGASKIVRGLPQVPSSRARQQQQAHQPPRQQQLQQQQQQEQMQSHSNGLCTLL